MAGCLSPEEIDAMLDGRMGEPGYVGAGVGGVRVRGAAEFEPGEVLDRAALEEIDSRIGICESINEAVTMAKFRLAMWEDLRQPGLSPGH